ncbi:nucleotidyltransferase domain-containing protein [Streptomyces coeruleoprunus]|uniref:Nucleotidyltransferase domain-containing protein n=1 Tax=Streptomyces coeruleoprunus TaxID=285563 RepID=A0ABV9XH56_9ACTN
MSDDPLDPDTAGLLDRFTAALRQALPLTALWAHGSLAGGDYRPGRSDLDLVAVLHRPWTPEERQRLLALHRRLDADVPLAAKLHCAYVAAGALDDPARDHPAWAHRELLHRPVTLVTRRELHAFGRVLAGPPPAGVVPEVTDGQLHDHIVEDLAGYWRPAVDHADRWLQDVWVDLGLLTLARAHETLRSGRLITKGQALDVLAALGAPADVVADIRRRRYDADPDPATAAWRARRAELTRSFLAPALDDAVRTARSRRLRG